MPVILCGDWNGSKRGHVYKILRSQGLYLHMTLLISIPTVMLMPHKWVSHRNHRGNICGVDFIWLRNPDKARKSLKTSWAEAIFGILKCQLQKASLDEDGAFALLKGDNTADFITYSSFCEALRQETKDLWVQADIDGNGVLDHDEFKQKIWNSTCYMEQKVKAFAVSPEEFAERTEEEADEAVGFSVLFPHEAERGLWPEHYSLSDHA